MARLDYVELPATDIAATRGFYERAFGWSMMQFAPTYAATTTTDTNIGLQSDSAEKPAAPLAVIQVDDLEAALAAVETAGGKIVKPIRSFPGGRRFHFTDPSGNELAAWQAAAEYADLFGRCRVDRRADLRNAVSGEAGGFGVAAD